jgi:hypothetical protein
MCMVWLECLSRNYSSIYKVPSMKVLGNPLLPDLSSCAESSCTSGFLLVLVPMFFYEALEEVAMAELR